MAEGFIKLLYPVAPHLAEEVWQVLGHEETITYEAWPSYDETKLEEEEVQVVLQVMGKVRAKVQVETDMEESDLEELALQNEKIQVWMEVTTDRKFIVIHNKLVNIVAN